MRADDGLARIDRAGSDGGSAWLSAARRQSRPLDVIKENALEWKSRDDIGLCGDVSDEFKPAKVGF
jgi:hypothetical protein